METIFSSKPFFNILLLSFLFLDRCVNLISFGKKLNADGVFTSLILSPLIAAILASIIPPVILKPFSVSSKLIGFSFSIFSNALAVLSTSFNAGLPTSSPFACSIGCLLTSALGFPSSSRFSFGLEGIGLLFSAVGSVLGSPSALTASTISTPSSIGNSGLDFFCCFLSTSLPNNDFTTNSASSASSY